MKKKSILTFGLVFFFLLCENIKAQPFAVYLNPGNSQYWLIKYNTTAGTHSDEVYLSGMTGYLSGDYSTFNAHENHYCFVGYNGAIYRFYSIDVINGLIVHDPVLGGNIIGIEYNCNDSLFYGLYESSGNYSIATLNPATGIVNALATVNNMDGAVAGSFFIDVTLNQYGFVAASGANFELRTYQLPSGNLATSNLFPDNIVGLEYSPVQNAVFGLWNNGGTYQLEQINTSTGNHTSIAILSGVNPGFIAEAQSVDHAGHYTFRGFNSGNQLSIFSIDLSNGTVLYSFLNDDNSSGFESSHCANVFMSIKNEVSDSIQIFPNPASQELKIKSPRTITSAVLYDLLGNEVTRFKNIDQNDFSLNISELNNAMYILQLNNSDGSSLIRRIIISRN